MKTIKIAGIMLIANFIIGIGALVWMVGFPKSYAKFVSWWTKRLGDAFD
jgi:hypothetical protein